MKAVEECYSCLKRLAFQAAGMAASSEDVRKLAAEAAVAVLDQQFSTDELTIVIASRIHQVIKDVTGNPDPYRPMKDRELAVARQWYGEIGAGCRDDYGLCIRLAALGNVIDFFKPYESLIEDLRKPVEFEIDDTAEFEQRLKQADNLMYLADNAGEVYFDIPLIRLLGKRCKVTYVVKERPVQNDITGDDIRLAGLEHEFERVITTGTATPGVNFAVASEQFIDEFNAADLVLAKGMGYWETLSELPAKSRVFHCLVAKCQPVADSIGVPLNSYVAMLR